MKHVEVTELLEAVPILVKMDRAAKLRHWASLVRQHQWNVKLVHGLEYYTMSDLNRMSIRQHAGSTALDIAASDPVLQAQGLSTNATVGEALRFFEVTQGQAHAFSCDCGGYINNKDQADRIERLA
jgi:hypothetical protein